MPLSDIIFRPPVIAHRGARAEAPENTLAAIRLAKEQGAAWVEVDVKLTQDGMPVLMHDTTLDRTTSGKGKLADMDWAEVEKYDAGAPFGALFKGERVPRLTDALHLVRTSGLRINIEIKPCKGRAKATAMVTLMTAAQAWPQDAPPPLVSSFDEETLAIAAQLQPLWPRSFAFEDWREDWHEVAAHLGAEALTVNEALLTPERMRVLAQGGLPILAYTVNDPARAKELLKQGVAAVFCDNPGAMIRAL